MLLITKKNWFSCVASVILFVVFFLFLQAVIPRITLGHHDSCLRLTAPDRIAECSQQALQREYARCERDENGAEAVRRCQDAAALHQGINPSSQNAASTSASTGQRDIDKLLARAVNILVATAGLAIVGSIIFGGLQYSSAGGNSSQVESAKNRIVVSVASLMMLGFGYFLLQWLIPGNIFG